MRSRSIWSPRNIYLYVVCLITLLLSVFAVVELVRAAVEIVYPEPVQPQVRVMRPPPGVEEAPIDEKQMEEQRETQRRWAVRNTVLRLVRNVAMLLVALPLYVYHWRKIEVEARPAPSDGDGAPTPRQP